MFVLLCDLKRLLTILIVFTSLVFVCSKCAQASSLSLAPSGGTYEIGSTFDVSIMLNTGGQDVNAVKASLSFPPNILQVVSPSAGSSVVHLWASPPTYSNTDGTIKLEGGFPGGTNLTNGLITKITFRVKGTGAAIIKILDDSKVLLNDGDGTDSLSQTSNGIYRLTLSAPAGPEVISETHPDQSRWYNRTSAILKWADPDTDLAEEYSYILSDKPDDIPDDISEGNKTNLSYNDLSDGRHYFHIKALNKDKVWGGTTHYALNIDKTPPADFSFDFSPSAVTARKNVIVQFMTTDSISGIDHYEFNIIPLNNKDVDNSGQTMFVEANSPHMIQGLDFGNYDVIVRAYDSAGNYKDSVRKLRISNALFQFVGSEGLIIRGDKKISWVWLFFIFMLITVALMHVSLRLRSHNNKIKKAKEKKDLPPDIKKKLEELKKFKKKYKGLTMVIVVVLYSLFMGTFSTASSEESLNIEPPIITTISRNISNNEIFYVGGSTKDRNMIISLFVKNSETGETFSKEVVTNDRGEWFYRHDTFLSDGNYILWAQGKNGEQMSPPGPQVEMIVEKTALQLGISRISYEMLSFLIMSALSLTIIILVLYIIISMRKLRRRNNVFKKEIQEVDDAVHKGFLLLHREIEKELKFIDEISAKKKLTEKESDYREHLINDIKRIERHIEKEIMDVERILR